MNINRLLGETIIYGIGAILPRVITFLLNPLYINYIDKEAFAIFTSLYAWIAFINIVLTFGFETSYFRFSGEDKTGAAEKNVFSTAFWFIAMLAGGFLVMVLLFSNPLSMLMDYGNHPEFLRWFAWIYAWGCVFMAFVSWQIPSMAIDRDYMTLKAIVVNVFIWLCILSAHIPWHPKTEK